MVIRDLLNAMIHYPYDMIFILEFTASENPKYTTRETEEYIVDVDEEGFIRLDNVCYLSGEPLPASLLASEEFCDYTIQVVAEETKKHIYYMTFAYNKVWIKDKFIDQKKLESKITKLLYIGGEMFVKVWRITPYNSRIDLIATLPAWDLLQGSKDGETWINQYKIQ